MPELSPLAQHIWDMKYRLKDEDGTPIEATIEDSWRRIATALAEPERARGGDAAVDRWRQRFADALCDFSVLPAGRIQAGAGSGRDVTLFNCFVMGIIPDDMSGIFDNLREAALTLQQGGGIGYDFSTLRPKGAPVKGVGADASGPLSFMDVWDAMCRTIMSAGSRRGAMMATLACDHPDIEAFVDAKRDPAKLRMFNLSVLVSDAFMQAVREEADWPLTFGGRVYRTVKARALWDKIMRATYDYAEPGVIFIDQINRRNNLAYCETITATNPCGEQPLPPYGACLLGSINLAALVRHPFEPRAGLDEARLGKLVKTAVRLLDNAIDVSRFPLPEQRAEAEGKRRIGLGITGLADALIFCGQRYGSAESLALVRRWMAIFRREAYLASAALAREKGAFPLYDKTTYLAGETIKALDPEVIEAIERDGMRNGLVTSVAPTGTISLLAGNLSSGIEPVFSFKQKRRILLPDGSAEAVEVLDHAYRLFSEMKGADAPLPEAFIDAQTLDPAAHLAMQAAVQDYIDSAVSKTINLPASISFEAFKEIYAQAYDLGCKGCTTYRPNAITGAVLEVASPSDAQPPDPVARKPRREAEGVVYMSEPLERPEVLPGQTYKLRWPESDHAIYITLNDIIQDGRRRPFEIFINSKNMEHYAWTLALTRMISAVFRRGGDVSFVVEELKAVFDPRGGSWMKGRYVPSLLAAIGEAIEGHMVEIGFLPGTAVEGTGEQSKLAAAAGDELARPTNLRQCPKCGAASLIRQEGCDVCTACTYSKCG